MDAVTGRKVASYQPEAVAPEVSPRTFPMHTFSSDPLRPLTSFTDSLRKRGKLLKHESTDSVDRFGYLKLMRDSVDGHYEEDNHSDPEDYVPSSPCSSDDEPSQLETGDDIRSIQSLDQQWFSWILVSGIPQSVSKYTLTLLFEDPSQGFGLPVKEVIMDMGKRQARVEFENPADAESVLRRQRLSGSVSLSNSKLTFSRYTPSPQESRKLLVLGLPADTTDARLNQKLFETSVDKTLIGTKNRAIVGFRKLSGKGHIEKLLKAISPNVEIHPVEVSPYVMVKYFSDYPMARQEFRLYFEQTDTFNAVVETVFCHPNNGYHVILFTDSKDAEKVSKQHSHEIAGHQVTVQVYYPCLDMEPYEMIDYPDPIPCHYLDPMVVNFIQKNQALMKKIEADLKKCHCMVQWVQQLHGIMQLKCTVFPTDPAAPTKIRQWKEDSVATFMKAIKGIKVKRGLHFADEVKKTMIEKLADFKQDSTEAVMSIGADNNMITVVGNDPAAKAFEKHLGCLIDDMENSQIGPGKRLTKMKRVTYEQMMLVKRTKFQDNADRHGVEVTSEDNMGLFRFIGKKGDVDMSIKQLIKTIESFVVKEIKDLRPIEVQLLKLPQVQEQINENIRTKKIVAILRLSRCDTLEVHGVSVQDITEAERIIRQSVCVIGPLHTDTRLDEHCLQFLSHLKCQLYSDKIVILTDNIRQIEIACIDSLYQDLDATVKGYFDDDRIVKLVHEVGKGRIDFMRQFMQQDVKDVTDEFAGKGVVIELMDTPVIQGFQLKGKKVKVREAIRKLNKMTACIAFSVHPLSQPSSREYLSSPEGIEVLNLLEKKFEGVAQVHKEEPSGQDANCKMDPMERAKFTSGLTTVYVMEGDVVFQKCKALIHFTDSKLNFNTPIGKCITHVGGFEIQRECQNHLKKSQQLNDGDIFVCSAGKLACSHIINVVTKVSDAIEDIFKLVESVTNCLVTAGQPQHGFNSLALTTNGINAPGEIKNSVRLLVTALGTVLRNHQQVEEVFLVDMDCERVDEIIEELEKNEDFQKCHVMRYELDRMSSLKQRVSGPEDDCDAAEFKPRKLNVKLVVGELAKQTADIIVNSSNERLDLKHGSVSKSLVIAAGMTLQNECKKKYPRRMNPGDMAVTSGGGLQCSYVLHTIISPWDHGNGHSEQMLKKVIQKCLMYADTQKKATIAFPALGTGFCCFPPKEAARIMLETIHSFEQTTLQGYLMNVILVVYTHDQKSIDAFREQFRLPHDSLSTDSSRRPSLLRPVSAIELHSAVTESMRPYSMSCGHTLSVEISQGDIIEERTDAIVNGIGREYTLGNGMVSKLISATAGPYVKREFMRAGNKQIMEEKGFVVTAGGLLLCDIIIHTRVHSSLSGIKQMVKNCLNEAERLKLSSVAFPALGTGSKGIKPETVAKAMLLGFNEFNTSRDSLGTSEKHVRVVKIVIYQSDIARKFVAVFSRQDRPTTFLSRFSTIGAQKSPEPTVSLHLYTRSAKGMESFKQAVNTHLA